MARPSMLLSIVFVVSASAVPPTALAAPSIRAEGGSFVADVVTGAVHLDTLTVTNIGDMPLKFDAEVHVNLAPDACADPEFVTFGIHNDLAEFGYYVTYLYIRTNDPDEPILDVQMDGAGMRAPDKATVTETATWGAIKTRFR